MLTSDDPIEQRPLVVVGDSRIGSPAEHMARELQHVVGRAVFLRVAGQGAREFPRIGIPPLAVARPTRRVGAPSGDFAPEVTGYVVVAGFAGELVPASGAD